MYLTGFADEAAGDIDGQIRATKELGWSYLESRNINGKNIHDISDADFDAVAGKLQAAGVKINCFGSAIANWAKLITDPFDSSLAEARRAIPRMQKLGAKLVRIMSFKWSLDDPTDDASQHFSERCRRVGELVKMFADAGMQAVHENCMNYGGMGWTFTQKLVDNVPGLKLVYDTGNPIFSDDRGYKEPYPKQSSWEFYSFIKEHIAYVHIKDGLWDFENEAQVYCWPGEGEGDVRAIVKDLLKNGYDGGISMEPHLASVFHDPTAKTPSESAYKVYVEYGRRFEQLLKDLGHGDKINSTQA